MHAVVYGTGKWANLLKIKLTSLDVNTIIVGNGPSADYTRSNFPVHKYKQALVFIASSTEKHLPDLLNCVILDPKAVYIEKGFLNEAEKDAAKIWFPKVSKFILCQYRYSKIFDVLKGYSSDILKVFHNWTVSNSKIEEWVPHIVSIDNFIRGTTNSYYTNEEGNHKLDPQSHFNIVFGKERILETSIETSSENIKINFGIDNSVVVTSKSGSIYTAVTIEKEDVLQKQLEDIIKDSENTILERL